MAPRIRFAVVESTVLSLTQFLKRAFPICNRANISPNPHNELLHYGPSPSTPP